MNTHKIIRDINQLGQGNLHYRNEFIERLKEGNCVREENPLSHVNVMFVPYNIETNSVFLVHHKKANMWIVPGGHIEKNEEPIVAVIREMKEELDYAPNKKDISLFDIAVTDINNPRQMCKKHFDIWYLINVPKINFQSDMEEFYDAQWVTIDEAIEGVKHIPFQKTIKRLEMYHPPGDMLNTRRVI